MNSALNYLLIISSKAPYSSAASFEAIEAALAATNIGLKVKFLLVDQGVLQLMPNQQPFEQKSILKKLNALPLFDVEALFVAQQALKQYAPNLSVPDIFSTINQKQLLALQSQAKQILVF